MGKPDSSSKGSFNSIIFSPPVQVIMESSLLHSHTIFSGLPSLSLNIATDIFPVPFLSGSPWQNIEMVDAVNVSFGIIL